MLSNDGSRFRHSEVFSGGGIIIEPTVTSQTWPESGRHDNEESTGPWSGIGNTFFTHLTWTEKPHEFLQLMLSLGYGSSGEGMSFPGDQDDCSSELTSPEEPAIPHEV